MPRLKRQESEIGAPRYGCTRLIKVYLTRVGEVYESPRAPQIPLRNPGFRTFLGTPEPCQALEI